MTRAAAALPLIGSSLSHAGADANIAFQYGRYQENDRDLFGVDSAYSPIKVDFLSTRVDATFLDLFLFELAFAQDTWSGATPIATAPRALGGNRPTSPDGVSGATPYLEGPLFLDADFQPMSTDGFGNPTGTTDAQLVHTISSASPETRREVDLALGWDGDRVDLRLGGGVSVEPDYLSGFVDLGAQVDLDRQNTILDVGVRYSHSKTDATLDHDAVPYIDMRAFADQIDIDGLGIRTLEDTRQDLSARLGLLQVIDRRTTLELSLRYQYSGGYLENPYKVVEVAFIDPDQQFLAPPGGYFTTVHALMEQRPNHRNEVGAAAQLVRNVEWTNTAVHLGYEFRADDWGIRAHVFDLELVQPLARGFTVSAFGRYMSQSEADFYVDYLVSPQAFRSVEVDGTGNVTITPFDFGLLPSNFSSDYRLDGFGVWSAGVTIEKYLGRGVSLSAGFEYYDHASDFQLGGGRSGGDFADFDAYLLSGSLHVDLGALALSRSASAAEHDGHRVSPGMLAPAGVAGVHMLEEVGSFMLGYRFSMGFRDGSMWNESDHASDAEVVAQACDPGPCAKAPDEMTMGRHMFDLMFAPTDWLNVAVMPQFVDTEMKLEQLPLGLVDDHQQHQEHSTGGWGDTRLAVLTRLYASGNQRLQAGLALNAPTGSVDERFRRSHQEDRGYVPYGMQLGSGTWDLLPSLTWVGGHGAWTFGAQVSGVIRLEHENDSGYALGDGVQATAWSGYAISSWLSGTLRGIYGWEGEIRGRYDGTSSSTTPPDNPDNYGGQIVDMGIGLRAVVPRGLFAGQSVAVEWLQPVYTRFNGYQLERLGMLVAQWRMHF